MLALSCWSLAEEIPADTSALALDDACDSEECDLSPAAAPAGEPEHPCKTTWDRQRHQKFQLQLETSDAPGREIPEQPAGDDLTFNLNWNFCFDEKTLSKMTQEGGALKKKKGNCQSFGCTKSFDFHDAS